MLIKKKMSKNAKISLLQQIINLLTQLRSHLPALVSTPFLVPMFGQAAYLDFSWYLLERTAQLNYVFLSHLNVPGMKRFQKKYRKKKKQEKLSLAEANAQLTEFQKR